MVDSYTRIYVSNLPKDIYSRDLREVFRQFGPIRYVEVKRTPNVFGCYYAFIEFHDRRDAEDAVVANGRIKCEGKELLVEHAVRANQRVRSRVRRSSYQLLVSGIPPSGSWQDLKSHMSSAGEVCFADVEKYRGTGIVEFLRYEDMKYALRKLDGSKFFSHEDEVGYIRLKETRSRISPYRSRSRSRSSSPTRRSRRRRSYSRVRRSRSHSKSRRSRYNSRSRSRSDSRSRSRSDSTTGSLSDSSSGSSSVSTTGSCSDSSSGSSSDSTTGSCSDSSSQSSYDSRGRRSRSHSGVRRSRSYSRSRSRSWGRRSHYPAGLRLRSSRHRTRSPSPRRSPDSTKKDK